MTLNMINFRRHALHFIKRITKRLLIMTAFLKETEACRIHYTQVNAHHVAISVRVVLTGENHSSDTIANELGSEGE